MGSNPFTKCFKLRKLVNFLTVKNTQNQKIMVNFKQVLKFSAIALYPAVNILCFNLPVKAQWNDFTLCSARLQRTGVDVQKATSVCGETLNPDKLSLCVTRINHVTSLSGNEALDGCFRSRRPLELAQCVGDIHRENTSDRQAQNVRDSEILDHCRRTLLPLNFSECVIGLSNSDYYPSERQVLPISLENAMKTCIQTR
jgi:hypothetical protein